MLSRSTIIGKSKTQSLDLLGNRLIAVYTKSPHIKAWDLDTLQEVGNLILPDTYASSYGTYGVGLLADSNYVYVGNRFTVAPLGLRRINRATKAVDWAGSSYPNIDNTCMAFHGGALHWGRRSTADQYGSTNLTTGVGNRLITTTGRPQIRAMVSDGVNVFSGGDSGTGGYQFLKDTTRYVVSGNPITAIQVDAMHVYYVSTNQLSKYNKADITHVSTTPIPNSSLGLAMTTDGDYLYIGCLRYVYRYNKTSGVFDTIDMGANGNVSAVVVYGDYVHFPFGNIIYRVVKDFSGEPEIFIGDTGGEVRNFIITT